MKTSRNIYTIYCVIFLLLSACGTKIKGTYYNPTKPIKVDFVKTYRDSMDRQMGAVIGYSAKGLTAARPQGTLNNFMADLCFNIANSILINEQKRKAHLCVLNKGGLRNPLPQGAIKLADAYKVMPFENELVMLKVSGACVDSMFKHISARGGEPISNAKYTITKTGYADATINNKPYDSRRSYLIITSDYLANGGDGMQYFRPYKGITLGIKVRDALIQKIISNEAKDIKSDAIIDNRVSINNE